MKPTRSLAGFIWLCAAFPGGCADKSTRSSPPPKVVLQEDAGVPAVDASLATDAGDADSAVDSSFDAGGDAGGAVRLRVGINLTPTAPQGDAGGLALGETLLQELELLALGVEATHLTMDSANGVPAAAGRLSARGVSVAVSVEAVSGRRPLLLGSPASWDVNEFVAGFEPLFAEPPSAEYLAIGSRLDLYWEESLKADRAAFSDFVVASMKAAKEHAARPPALKIGFDTRLQSWLESESEQALRQWAAVADFVGISWLPLDSASKMLAPDAAVTQLREFFARTKNLKIPILFLRVAYPEAGGNAGPLSSQAAFYKKLFEVIRDGDYRLPFLAVSSLNDPELQDCAAVGADFSPRDPEPFTEAWCAIGLRDRYLTPKPAYSSVIEGLASFSSR